MRTPLFAANWKMNKAVREVPSFFKELAEKLSVLAQKGGKDFEVVIAPPATHLAEAQNSKKSTCIELASQNCGIAESGAFTGEVSPVVLKELGCTWVILGHSERRHVFLETHEMVQKRLEAALKQGLKPILCVGEKIEERKANQTFTVIEKQLEILAPIKAEVGMDSLVIAYEPVWAIGTGENASPEQAEEVHLAIRGYLKTHFSSSFSENTRILYGGSVKPDNSEALMRQKNIDGFLVGGASLEVKSFASIIENALKTRG